MLVHIVTAIILLATAAVVSIYTKKNVLSPVNVAWQLLTISLNSVSSSQPPMHVHLHTHKYTHTQIHTHTHTHIHTQNASINPESARITTTAFNTTFHLSEWVHALVI